MSAEIRTIATKWGVESILADLATAEASTDVTIGLLGDFSSGKTTLINELVGVQDLLPTRLEPCTASAGLVLAVEGAADITCYRLSADGNLSKISRVELADIARALAPGRPVVHVPSTEAFPAGLGLADTPGLGSLAERHFEVLFSELPYLDAAIICVDISKGGLTRSVVDFLKSPGVRHLQHRFLIALTHADLKSTGDAEAVRMVTAQALAAAVGISTTDALARVVVSAAGPVAAERGRVNLREVQGAIHQCIVARRATIADERRSRAALRLIPALSQALNERLTAIRGSESEAAKRMAEINQAVDGLHSQRAKHENRLRGLHSSLSTTLRAVCRDAGPAFAAAATTEETAEVAAALAVRITTAVDTSVAEHRDAVEGFVTPDMGALVGYLGTVNRVADIGKSLASAALFAAVLPTPAGLGAAASNAAQAGAGAAASQGGRFAAALSAAGGFFGRVVGGVAKGINDINPVKLVGDLIAEKYKAENVEAHLDALADSVARGVVARLATVFEDQHFQPIEQQLTELAAQVKVAEADRRAEADQKRRLLRDLETDLGTLSALSVV
jgi:signal recognition particle receptor subunit beta